MSGILNRRSLIAGATGLITASSLSSTAYAQDDLSSIAVEHSWTSGGEDPSAYGHDEAMDEFGRIMTVEKFPDNAKDYFSNRAKANGGQGSKFFLENLEEGQMFACQCFGGKKPGSTKKVLKNVAAYPSRWKSGAPRGHRYWTWEGVNARGERITVGYSVPLVCGNSSAILYRKGAPVCVPIPRSGVASV